MAFPLVAEEAWWTVATPSCRGPYPRRDRRGRPLCDCRPAPGHIRSYSISLKLFEVVRHSTRMRAFPSGVPRSGSSTPRATGRRGTKEYVPAVVADGLATWMQRGVRVVELTPWPRDGTTTMRTVRILLAGGRRLRPRVLDRAGDRARPLRHLLCLPVPTGFAMMGVYSRERRVEIREGDAFLGGVVFTADLAQGACSVWACRETSPDSASTIHHRVVTCALPCPRSPRSRRQILMLSVEINMRVVPDHPRSRCGPVRTGWFAHGRSRI